MSNRLAHDAARARLEGTRTDSSIEVRSVYTSEDLPGGAAALDERLGLPGEAPFTRGPYRSMYRGQLWTMRQFAGYGSSEETNERFKFLLRQGQTALSVAFDLPTQLGYDSDHELARPEVGRVGVAIDTAPDMERLFESLPLDEVSVNFTINATAPIILAMYLVAAERQNVPYARLSGTLQNDILKEFLSRKLFVYPPAPSMRMAADVVEFASENLPRFNPISITGYHAREAGCDAVLLALHGAMVTHRYDDGEGELLNRIRELEEQNSVLRDKLDMIYAILASDYEETAVDDSGEDDSGLVQIGN